MSKKRLSPEQIIHLLREVEIHPSEGKTISQAVRPIGVTEQTYLFLEEGIRGIEYRPGKASKGTGKGKHQTKAIVCRPFSGERSFEGFCFGKLISPVSKCRATDETKKKNDVSERRTCLLFSPHRITQRYDPRQSEFNEKLTQRIIELACCFGRYGYRRIHQLPAREGWQINHKRLERIWGQEVLKVPSKQPKRSRLWFNDGSWLRLKPLFENHVWLYDFLVERTQFY